MSDSIDLLTEESDSGPKKSFWSHLADLRTALVRSAIAIGVATIVCLLVADKFIALLEYPLQHIDIFQKPQPTIAFRIGAQQLGPYTIEPGQFAGLPAEVPNQAVFEVGTARIGEEQVATLKLLPPTKENQSGLRIRLLNLGPADAFFVAFKVSIYAAIIVSAPFWMYFMGQFFLPALNRRERQAIFPWVGWSVLLFMIGVGMTYFFLLPLALHASVEYSHLLGFSAYDWRAESYLGFVTKFLLGMGLGFQFPVVVLLLVKLGLVTHEQLGHYRRHVVVLCLVMGAILTTPEVITQVSMAVPLYILYEISIWIAWYWAWKARRAEASAG